MTQPTAGSMMSRLVAELRRRRVFRVAIVYALAGWIVIQVASTMLPGLKLPNWTVTLVIALVVLGFPLAVIMGWMFDMGPRGVERTAVAGPAGGATPAAEVAAAAGRATPGRPPAAPDNRPTESRPDAHEQDRRGIAVLPFVNMSGRCGQRVLQRRHFRGDP